MKIYANNEVISQLVADIEVHLADIFCQDLGIDALKEAIKPMLPEPISMKAKGEDLLVKGGMRYITRNHVLSLVELIYRV